MTDVPHGDDPNYETHCVCLTMSHEYQCWRWIKDNPAADFSDFVARFEGLVDADVPYASPKIHVGHVNAHMSHIRNDL